MRHLRLFVPILAGASFRDRLLACFGAVLGIALAAAAGAISPLPLADLPMIVAPMGASAVLLFAVPASPLAQPWSVLGGNVISAAVGVAVAQLVPNTIVAAGLAVGLAILVMSLTRCLHPPGGAAALTAVIGGPAIHAAGFGFAFTIVALNAVVLAAAGWLFHRVSGHSWPHRATPPAPAPAALHRSDIDVALEEMGETFDISSEDLEQLLQRAEAHALRRRLG